MTITINTNTQALSIQRNLNSATSKMNTAMQRMSTGYRINSASDDAAGLAVATKMETTISSAGVAAKNVQIGSNLLDTAEGTLSVLQSNLQRIRDLAEQAANGTYTDTEIQTMEDEAVALASQIDSTATSASFNGKRLFDTASTGTNGIALQVGTDNSTEATLTLSNTLFTNANVTGLRLTNIAGSGAHYDTVAAAFESSATAKIFLSDCDVAIGQVSTRVASIGAYQNRLEAVSDGLDVQVSTLTAAKSTIMDADVAEESAAYVQAQILQSASASLLVQANSAPQIALQLING